MIRLTIDDEPILTERLLRLLDVPDRLDGIEFLLTKIIQKERQIMASIDDVLADVTAQSTVIDSIGALIQGMKDQLAAQGVDQAKIDAAFAGLEKNNASLAVFTNTPTPPPEPVV